MVKCRVLLLDGTEFACDVNVSGCFLFVTNNHLTYGVLLEIRSLNYLYFSFCFYFKLIKILLSTQYYGIEIFINV